MTKNLGLTDYIYYGVDLRVKSIADLDNVKYMASWGLNVLTFQLATK